MESKSDSKKELIGILVEINRLVTEHLKVQKGIFDPPMRAKFSIPFIPRRTDFESLYESNKKIQTELNQIIDKMKKEKNELNLDPFIYGGIKDYAHLFHTSSEKLTQIAFELNLKVKKQNKLTDEEYNQLVKEHQVYENARLQKGKTIQKIAGLLVQ